MPCSERKQYATVLYCASQQKNVSLSVIFLNSICIKLEVSASQFDKVHSKKQYSHVRGILREDDTVNECRKNCALSNEHHLSKMSLFRYEI